MAKSFKDFYEGTINDAKKAFKSLEESDNKYLEKRSKKYFIDEDINIEVEDIPLDEETYKKYIKND